MSLDLDPRQRAMLHEMGVHVWWPQAVDRPAVLANDAIKKIATSPELIRARAQNDVNNEASIPTPPSTFVTTQNQPPGPAPASPPRVIPVARSASLPIAPLSPTVVTALPAGIADMAWPALGQAVSCCQACAMCLGRRAAVLAAPKVNTPCDWLVLGDPPDELEERAGQPFVDAPGKLLDNMLRAVGVQRLRPDLLPEVDAAESVGADAAAKRAYLSHVLKCRPALARAPSAEELSTCSHYLRREIALTQPKVLLAMGRFAMHLLLSETPPEQAKQPLGKLRGQVWRFAGVPVVVTYPPAYLLRSGQDKGKAWADLCLALDVAQGRWPAQD